MPTRQRHRYNTWRHFATKRSYLVEHEDNSVVSMETLCYDTETLATTRRHLSKYWRHLFTNIGDTWLQHGDSCYNTETLATTRRHLLEHGFNSVG
jgi:hypothetical protein